MTDKEFWKIINDSKKTSNDFEEQKSKLKEILLENYSSHDVILFKYFFEIYKINLYRWDLFVAYRLISNECDEDYFLTFREWIVAQGNEFYYNIIENPDKVLYQVPENEILVLSDTIKDISYGAIEAYIEMTNDNSIQSFIHLHDRPNDDWADPEFDEKNSLPLLTKKYEQPYN